MNETKLMSQVLSVRKGANVKLNWRRPAKVKANCPHVIEKETDTTGRFGPEYDNLKIVKEKRESGELPAKNKGLLPGMSWSWHPYLVQHKNGQKYLRVYNPTNKVTPNVTWYKDGEPVRYKDVEPFLLASEKKENTRDCFTVKVENVISVN